MLWSLWKIYILFAENFKAKINTIFSVLNVYFLNGLVKKGDQNDEDTRTFCGKFLYNAIASTDNAQHKNCPSSASTIARVEICLGC